MFNSLKSLLVFVDIVKIVDNHYLKIIFIILQLGHEVVTSIIYLNLIFYN